MPYSLALLRPMNNGLSVGIRAWWEIPNSQNHTWLLESYVKLSFRMGLFFFYFFIWGNLSLQKWKMPSAFGHWKVNYLDASSEKYWNVCVLLQRVIADALCCQVCPCIDCTEIIFVEGNGSWGRGGGERLGGKRERPQFGTRGRGWEVCSGSDWTHLSLRRFSLT